MPDIYEQLAKHFSGENIQEDQPAIEKFKSENPSEYEMLYKLWTAEGISVHQFDSNRAYEKLDKGTTQGAVEVKVVPLYHRLAKIASIAAMLLLVSYIAIPYFNGQEEALLVEMVGDGSKEGITLDDGSTIYLNKGAKLSYPTAFDDKNRLVTLTGEAYFDIVRDESRPFKIKTNHSEVEVLGTSFNIDTDALLTEVAVTSGKVQVTSLTSDEKVILVKNQAATIDHKSITTYSLENENFIAWRTGVFTFKDESIATVIDELNKFYSDEIYLKSQSSDCVLSASFDKTSVRQVLEIITLSCNLNVTETNGIYELK